MPTIKTTRRALTAPIVDPHPALLAKWRKLDADATAADTRASEIWDTLPGEVRHGRAGRLARGSFVASDGRELERLALDLLDAEIANAGAVASTHGPEFVEAAHRRGEFTRSAQSAAIRAHAQILADSGWIAESWRAHVTRERADALLDRIAATPAKTVAGLAAQARALQALLSFELNEDERSNQHGIASALAGALQRMATAA